MTASIKANFPARKGTWAGKPHIYEAHSTVYEQDDSGRWSTFACDERQPMTEADVIADCRTATNWRDIMIANFPMIFAALQSGE